MNNFINPIPGAIPPDSIKFFTHHANQIEIEFSEDQVIIDCVTAQLSNPKFKVLKLTNCPNIDTVERICMTEVFGNALRDSSHWFFVIFEVTEPLVSTSLSTIISRFNYRKPVIFQVTSADSSVIFVKSDRDFGSFNLYDIRSNLHSIYQGAGLLSLIYALKKRVSDGDLLHLRFDASEVHSSDDVRLIHQASQSNDILSLRFLMLYDWDLSRQNKDNRRILEMDAFNGRPETFAALLDLPFNIGSHFLMISEDRSNLLELLDSDGMTILMRAAMSFGPETLEYLIRCGANVHYKRKKLVDEVRKNFIYESASDIAYCYDRSDNLKILLEADGFFPESFELHQIKNDEIRRIATERIKFFDDMQQGRIDDVQSFLNQNLRLKRVLSISNVMAMNVACELQQQNPNADELVTLLMQHGCWFPDGSHLNSSLEKTSREELAIHFPNFNDMHIHCLLSRTRFATVSQTEAHKYKVEEMYQKLNQIPMTRTLMMIVQHHPDLDIIFDFDKQSTVSIDPTSNFGVFGSVLFKIGRIYIGAKSVDPQHVIGTLAHEMAHLVMQMLYDNNCQPYRIHQTDLQLKFLQIVNNYYEKLCRGERYDNIVESVYRYYIYTFWPAELIVRIPHMTAYRKDIIAQNQISTEFQELFQFYDQHVQPDINDFILHAKDYKRRMMVAKLNKTLGNFDRRPNVQLVQDKLEKFNVQASTTVHILATTQPNLLICCLKQKLQASAAVFATIHQIPLFGEELKMVHNYRDALLVIVFTGNENFNNEECEKFFVELNENKKLIVIQNSKCKTFNDDFNIIFQSKSIISVDELKWSDLTESSREEVSSFLVSFQGIPMRLNQLFTDDTYDAIDDLNLESFFTNDVVEIGGHLPLSVGYDTRYFIQRDFGEKENSKIFSTENFDPEQQVLHEKVIVIIHGPAGTGKSTALTNIALQLKTKKPTYWIEKVDLKKISDSLELYLEDDITELLIEARLEPKQPNIFRKFFESGRLILMLDGFDEIDASNRERLVELLNDSQLENQVWLTTRGDCLKELKDLPNKLEVTLRPFDRNDQIKFMVEYWQSIIGSNNTVTMKQIAWTLIDRFEKCIKQKLGDLLGTPLQTRMLAEIFIPDKDLNINYRKVFDAYSLYNQFISARLQILYKEKNFNGNYVDIWKAGWEFHERKARTDSKLFEKLELHILNRNANNSIQFITQKECTKIGLLQLNADGKIEFIHRTFAEFFIAHFIANQLVNSEFEALLELTANKVIVYFINSYLEQNESIQANLPDIAEKLIAKQAKDKTHLKTILAYCDRNKLDGVKEVLGRSIVSVKDSKNLIKLLSIDEDDDKDLVTVWFSKVIAIAEKGISTEW